MGTVIEYIVAGTITYMIAVCVKYFIKIIWAVLNWIAQMYIEQVLNAEVVGEPMVDYYPAKEIFKIRKALRK